MQESTQAQATTNTPRAFGWCSWHNGNAEGVRVIQAIEQGSGPGHAVLACAPCRDRHHLVPLADRP